MKWFLDGDYKHWAVMPNDFNETRSKGVCPLCNLPMHPHYTGEPKEVGLSSRQMVEVRILPLSLSEMS